MTVTLGDSLNRRIKQQLINKIGACASVAKVYGFDRFPLEQWPAVIVKYTGIDGEFATTSENQRRYGYSVKILVPIGKDMNEVTDDRLQFAEEAVGQVVEEIMNTVDHNFELNQFDADVHFVNAVDSIFTEYQYEGGYAHGAEMTIVVSTYFNTSS